MVTMTDQPGQQQETETFLCEWKELEDAIGKDICQLTRCRGSSHSVGLSQCLNHHPNWLST